MRLDPKTIPSIARDSIAALMVDGDIEVEPMRIGDAEMDFTAIMREYLTNDERVRAATREALDRRGLDESAFERVQREMADARGFKTGAEGIEYVVDQMIEFLLISRNVEEVFAGDDLLRTKLRAVMARHLDISPHSPPGSTAHGEGAAPPEGGGLAGGLPAEVRAWEVRRGETPEEPDPERGERAGPEAIPAGRKN